MHTDAAPYPVVLELLRYANDADGLDVGEGELFGHHRTETYREVIHRAYAAGRTEPAGELLEAVHVGLTPEQELRATALEAAIAFVDEAADWDDATQGIAPVLAVAERFAAWIADGDPAPAQDAAFEGSPGAVESRTGVAGGTAGGEGE